MNGFGRLSFKNLGRNLKRNLATASAIALGFAGILILEAYYNRTSNYLRVYTIYLIHTGHLAIFAPDGFERLSYQPRENSFTPDDQALIEEVLQKEKNVSFYERQLRGSGLIGNGCFSFPFYARGIEPEVDKKIQSDPEVKRWLPDFIFFLRGKGLWNYPPETGAIALSRGLTKGLGKTRVYDEIAPDKILLPDCGKSEDKKQFARDANVQLLSRSWEGNMFALDGEVVAHYTTGIVETDNSALLAGVDLMQKLLETPNLGQYAIWLKDPQDLKGTARRLKIAFLNRGKNYEILKWNEEKLSPVYTGTTEFVLTMVGFMGMILVIVIGLSVLNASTMTVLERSTEIGMYRSLGFNRRQIRYLFTLESFWLALIAVVFGALVAFSAISGINALKIVFRPPGIADEIFFVLIPQFFWGFISGLIILILSVSVTWIVIRRQLRKNIALLLGGPVQ